MFVAPRRGRASFDLTKLEIEDLCFRTAEVKHGRERFGTFCQERSTCSSHALAHVAGMLRCARESSIKLFRTASGHIGAHGPKMRHDGIRTRLEHLRRLHFRALQLARLHMLPALRGVNRPKNALPIRERELRRRARLLRRLRPRGAIREFHRH